ncbi:flavonol 7-O-beta-glucosyltransferase UGT74F1 [Eucalyptus grandis]|uniref:flavonol 7-O-beta-glucosyltransferase UGT74F1 n=1 Tax=Eucalyptus grandis TaxID=71139 RepID=UPI00192EB551|nr:flavonol 7-O-beta-glucosyltransferase UGT74F1 [Eucalyptus grandis]
MEESSMPLKPHCLILSYPSQGHINPMLQFAKRLLHKGVKVTLVTTKSISKTLHGSSTCTSIPLEVISDGFDSGGIGAAGSPEAYLERFWKVGPETLSELVERLIFRGPPPTCIVYDSFLPWALDVARKFKLVGAAFFTMSCAVNSVFYHCQKGWLEVPVKKQVLLPGMSPLEPRDMPSLVCDLGTYPGFTGMLVNQFSNLDKVDWVLCNTVYELDPEVADWFMKILPFRTIGPTVPSTYLDSRLEQDKEYGFSIFEPDHDTTMRWLSTKPKGSVVYVSFGSMAELKTDQMHELAMGLKRSNCYFLWVVRSSEAEKLPQGFANCTETSQKGLIVTWCPQLEVLAHEALGLFVTHCGWNSTLEALSLGVPMLAIPQWTDQATNAKYIMDVWKMGLRPLVDEERGVVTSEEIEHCLRKVMEEETRKKMKENAGKWRKITKDAVGEGGKSDRNIEEFVAKLGART